MHYTFESVRTLLTRRDPRIIQQSQRVHVQSRILLSPEDFCSACLLVRHTFTGQFLFLVSIVATGSSDVVKVCGVLLINTAATASSYSAYFNASITIGDT